MWISKLEIANFKKALNENHISIEFKAGLNVLIGENNIGKTTVVEALALCLNCGSSDRNVWLTEDCFHDPAKPITIGLEFSGLSDAQQAAFLEALVFDVETGNHRLRFDFVFQHTGSKIHNQIRCGETGETTNPWELLGYLRAIFLPALRDVNLEFKPGYRSRVGNLLKKRIVDEGSDLEAVFQQANRNALALNGDENPVVRLERQTNANIDKLSLRGDNNRIKLNFVEQEYTKILSSILMTCEAQGLDIGTNGLGYNNLIFISTVLTDLKYDKVLSPHTFSCLIIEEPEAHLHPQLQGLLLEFLQNEYKDIQVILTSHSPTLTSVVNLDNINILCSNDGVPECILLQKAGITLKHKKFLELFFDVTKSQLFFARAVIFVEGISEAILLRSLWNYVYRTPEDSFDKQGIEIVNIQGVSFTPYVDLVTHVFARSIVRCAIITDDDRGTGWDCPEQFRFKRDGQIRNRAELVPIFDRAPISSRASTLKSAIDELKAAGKRIDIFLAKKTLEVEFGISNYPSKRRLSRILKMQFDSDDAIGFGIELWMGVSSQNKKSDFASIFARMLRRDIRLDKTSLIIPDYIRNAFEYLKNA